MANRRPTRLLSKEAHDLQTAFSAARIDTEHRIRPPNHDSETLTREILAYRATPEARELSASWALAGVVRELARAVEDMSGVVAELVARVNAAAPPAYTEVTAEERAALAAPEADDGK